MTVVVYSGDSFALANDRLDEAAASFRRLAGDCESAAWYPALADHVLAKPTIYLASLESVLLIEGLHLVSSKADLVGDHLVQAREWYESADQFVVDAMENITEFAYVAGAELLTWVGRAGAGALVMFLANPGGQALLAGVLAGGGVLVSTGVVDSDEVKAQLGELGQLASDQLGPLLSNPVTVMFLRGLVSSSDDIANNAIYDTVIPAPIAAGAGSLLTILGVGPLRDARDIAGRSKQAIQGDRSPNLQVSAQRTAPRAAPSSVRQVVDHIPRSQDGSAQVRISTYRNQQGKEVHLVSVAGTSSGELGGDNVFDNLSNLAAYAGDDDQSIAAVELAMAEAGIEPGDEVVFSGYSQGALVVTRLAESGQWQVKSVVTAGSPAHGNEIPGDIPVVQLEHNNDPITALQGIPDPPRNQVALVVRNTHPGGVPPGSNPLAGHMFDEYQLTADQYDQLEGEYNAAHRERTLAALQDAEVVSSTDYTITRKP